MIHRNTVSPVDDVAPEVQSYIELVNGGGQPLPESVRSYFEPRFGRDFGDVRVHADSTAEEATQAVNAHAFTVGRDIMFCAGQYDPGSEGGKRLLAHELTHVVQQDVSRNYRVQRQFCKPYKSAAEIAEARAKAVDQFVPALTAIFGSDVGALWTSFIMRRPGDSLVPVVFDKPGNSIHDAFANSHAIANEQNTILGLIADRIGRISLMDHMWTLMSIDKFISPAEKELSTDFDNPVSIPGNIAGGIGLSDAGWDYRRILRGNVSFVKKPHFSGLFSTVLIKTTLLFEVGDAIDFCPGQSGALVEQPMTIPLSRLEASREAYDVPYVVRFFAPSISESINIFT